jgi:hypothetical protein
MDDETLLYRTRLRGIWRSTLRRRKPDLPRARLGYTSNIEGVNTMVARIRAELADAEFDLDQTTTRTAGPGFVTQVSLRPGMYAIPTQLRTRWRREIPRMRDRSISIRLSRNGDCLNDPLAALRHCL